MPFFDENGDGEVDCREAMRASAKIVLLIINTIWFVRIPVAPSPTTKIFMESAALTYSILLSFPGLRFGACSHWHYDIRAV